MQQHTDASLVADALAGEAESFCALVRKYQDYVYGVTLGILADFHLALDAAQEAFLCAYCDLAKLKDPGRFGAWLCGIARNTAFEIRRDRQRQQALASRAAEFVEREAPAAVALAGENEQCELVQEALLAINEKDREALTLYYADGLSYSEICGFLGVSQGTLKGRLQRGRAALRQELTMAEQSCKDNAPDEAFAKSLERAIGVFTAKGPATAHVPSPWLDSIKDETRRMLGGGDEGFRIAVALSHAGSAQVRWRAAITFGLMNDQRSLRELERMMSDRSAQVRCALGWYARRIHPQSPQLPHEVGMPAQEIPPGVERLLELLKDENFNVRKAAVGAVAAYLPTGDPHIVSAMNAALRDPKHKVHHAAARTLRVPCPGCGRSY